MDEKVEDVKEVEEVKEVQVMEVPSQKKRKPHFKREECVYLVRSWRAERKL